MTVSAQARTILMFLKKRGDKRGNIFGSIAANTGISRTEVEELCALLIKQGLVEIIENRIFITPAGKDWVDAYLEIRDDRIREYVYDDYEFSLLRFVNELEMPMDVDEFPEVLKEEAPKVTTGSATMNLIHHLEIMWGHYFHSAHNKYSITTAGRKRYERLAREKGLSLDNTKQKQANSEPKFNTADVLEMNNKLDELKEMISTEFEKVRMGQEFIYNDMIQEFEEMRQYYNLPKKTWRQLFAGKLVEMTMSGLISEVFSKRIADQINPVVDKLLE